MKEWIKQKRLSFKFGTLEWITHFGFPTGLIMFSWAEAYSYFKDTNHPKAKAFLIAFIWALLIGIITYKFQLDRLKFKTFKLTIKLDEFKEKTRELLLEENWEINYDNNAYILATYRGSVFNLDMLTLRYKKNEIQWNVIHHPDSKNAIAALLSLNRQGRKIIKKIKAYA